MKLLSLAMICLILLSRSPSAALAASAETDAPRSSQGDDLNSRSSAHSDDQIPGASSFAQDVPESIPENPQGASGWDTFSFSSEESPSDAENVLSLAPPFDAYYAPDPAETEDDTFCPVVPVPAENGQYARFYCAVDLTLPTLPDESTDNIRSLWAGTELALSAASSDGWMALCEEDGSKVYLHWNGERTADNGMLYESLFYVMLADDPLPIPDADTDASAADTQNTPDAQDATCSTTQDCNLFSGPGMQYPVSMFLPGGSAITWLNESRTDEQGMLWHYVSAGNTSGWIISTACQLSAEEEAAALAAEKSTRIAAFPAPQPVDAPVIDPPAAEEYAPRYTGQYVVGKTGNSYLRDGPTLRDEKIGSLRKGSSLPFLGETSVDERGVVWYMVEYKGNPAWVSSRYTALE